MIKLDILSLLKAKGKSKYWLYKQLGMSYQNFNRMVNMICTPFTGHPVEGVLLCGTHMSTKGNV